MGNKDKKNSSFSSTVRSLADYIFSGDVKTSKAAAPGGPVATMVAASKHFSSHHKVRFVVGTIDGSHLYGDVIFVYQPVFRLPCSVSAQIEFPRCCKRCGSFAAACYLARDTIARDALEVSDGGIRRAESLVLLAIHLADVVTVEFSPNYKTKAVVGRFGPPLVVSEVGHT